MILTNYVRRVKVIDVCAMKEHISEGPYCTADEHSRLSMVEAKVLGVGSPSAMCTAS